MGSAKPSLKLSGRESCSRALSESMESKTYKIHIVNVEQLCCNHRGVCKIDPVQGMASIRGPCSSHGKSPIVLPPVGSEPV